MKDTIKEAKCPYCNQTFKHRLGSDLQCLWGEYAPSSIQHKCENCGREITISVEKRIVYHVKK